MRDGELALTEEETSCVDALVLSVQGLEEGEGDGSGGLAVELCEGKVLVDDGSGSGVGDVDLSEGVVCEKGEWGSETVKTAEGFTVCEGVGDEVSGDTVVECAERGQKKGNSGQN